MSSSKDSPAFPCDNPNSVYRSDEFTGLTKLEYFSAMAMQAILGSEFHYKEMRRNSGESGTRAFLAWCAVQQAQALVKELEEPYNSKKCDD